MKFQSTENNYADIYGSTVINHRIRCKLGLSTEQYCFMDYLHKREKQVKRNIFITDPLELNLIRKELGFELYAVGKLVEDLVEDDILSYFVNSEHLGMKGIKIDKIWKDEFENSIDEDFKTSGRIYGNVENK